MEVERWHSSLAARAAMMLLTAWRTFGRAIWRLWFTSGPTLCRARFRSRTEQQPPPPPSLQAPPLPTPLSSLSSSLSLSLSLLSSSRLSRSSRDRLHCMLLLLYFPLYYIIGILSLPRSTTCIYNICIYFLYFLRYVFYTCLSNVVSVTVDNITTARRLTRRGYGP